MACNRMRRIDIFVMLLLSSYGLYTFTNRVIQSISNRQFIMVCLRHSNMVRHSLNSLTLVLVLRFQGKVLISP